MSLKFMYITNRPDVAAIADKYGVDRVWIDLETLGKQERQANVDSVKSHHEISDVSKVKPVLKNAELLVRVNPINRGSKKEIDDVIDAGADIVMLPMWKGVAEVSRFLQYVGGRVKTTLLLETKEAAECLDEVLGLGGFDEIHIGLNDLHLSYGLTFMFELLSDGTVEKLCNKIAACGIPYGFGGIAGLGQGMLPAEKILIEHYRLGSTRVILSRSFCDADKIGDITGIDNVFRNNLSALRSFETNVSKMTDDEYVANHEEIADIVASIVKAKKESLL